METAMLVLDALEMEAELYSELAVTLADAREGLSAMSVDGIYKAVGVQEKVVERLTRIEKDREQAVKRLSRELGCQAPMNMSGLIGGLPEPWKNRFSDISIRLSSAIRKVENEKKLNAEIINKALAHVEESLYILGGATNRSDGYGALGAPAQDGHQTGLLSTKV
ncbi:MAG TPA: flagellar protein FlgN [Nitrospirota bacterium]|jgi:septation ring formation regulator EzrA